MIKVKFSLSEQLVHFLNTARQEVTTAAIIQNAIR